jgi:hypothetical protein
VDRTPHGHGETTTFLSALPHHRLTSPMIVGGAIIGAIFHVYVCQVLVTTLRAGDIVVMDNFLHP